ALLRVGTGTNSVVTISNDITLSAAAGSFSHASSGQVTTLAGQLSGGAGTATFRVTGTTDDSGVFILPSANPGLTVGTISIFEGQLALGHPGAVGSAGTIVLNTTTSIAAGSLGGLRLDNSMTLSQNLLFSDANVINTQANHGTVAGVISGAGAFAKAGSGKLSITNAGNTHTGTIFLNAGELNVRAPGVIAAATNSLNVAAGATLSGDGTINRAVVASDGAIIAPGNSLGTLTAGSASLTSTNLNIQINAPSADVFAVTGTLTLAGSSTLNLSGTLATGSFDFMTFGSLGGSGSVTLGVAPNGFGYIIGSDTDSYFVQVGTANYIWDTDPATASPQDGGGTWSTGSNFWENFGGRNYAWQNDAANAVTFGTTGGSGATVTVDGAKTVRSLTFVQNYTLNGASISIAEGITANTSATINAPVAFLSGNHTHSVAAGAQLTMGQITGGAGLSLTKTGPGGLRFATSTHTGGINVNAGTLIADRLSNGTLSIAAGATAQVTAKGAPNSPGGTTIVPELNLAGTPASPTAALDLTNNSFVIDYLTLGSLETDTRQRLSAGLSSGQGILSSMASLARRLGYADNAGLGLTVFNGQAVDSTSLLIMFTVTGDSNLDGAADLTDFAALGSNFNLAGNWRKGDFNYDGAVDLADFSLLAAQFNQTLPAGLTRPSPVPEPSTLGLLLAAAGLARRRRRRG
ncbi:MAG: autotransporter-associated beta strand repeat-containing protein, partial [Phycisphaerae bacterium]|nr:autotransporter-associated beta strand repeat-containing protein [Phycisphaerae bacterium]